MSSCARSVWDILFEQAVGSPSVEGLRMSGPNAEDPVGLKNGGVDG